MHPLFHVYRLSLHTSLACAQVACSDGKVFKADMMAENRVSGPVLTDEEMEAKYRWGYFLWMGGWGG